MLLYNSNNGYYGTFSKSKFLGFEHYDLVIRRRDTNEMYYHATYTESITLKELRELVETFPEFYKRHAR